MRASSQAPPLPWRVTSGEHNPSAVEQLLRMLPGWFGVESSITEYVEAARYLPTYLAWRFSHPAARHDRQPAGALLAARHFPCSAEIHLMAVDPAMHRRGAGRALIAALETDLTAEGVQFLQVKTLGPSRQDTGYDQTRQFYASIGFQPLEEIRDLWPENPCLIMIKTLR